MSNDNGFYKRADEHIRLSNEQVTEEIEAGKVSASFMYSLARFNAWISARGFENASDMENAKEEIMEYFTKEYTNVLEENLNDYIKNFDSYINNNG